MGCTCSCVGSDDYNDPEKYGAYVVDPLHALTPAAVYNARLGSAGAVTATATSDPSERQQAVSNLVAAYADIEDAYDARSGGEPTEEPDDDMIDSHRGQYVLNAYIRHGINASADQYPAPAMPLSVINAARRNVSAWIGHVVSPRAAAAMEVEAEQRAATTASGSERARARKLGASYEATSSSHASAAASDEARQGSPCAPVLGSAEDGPVVSGTSESVSGCTGHPPAAGWNTLRAFPVKHRATTRATAAAAAAAGFGATTTPTLTNSLSKGSSVPQLPSRSSGHTTTTSSVRQRHAGRQVDVATTTAPETGGTAAEAAGAPDFSCGIMISHASGDVLMSSL